MNFSHSKLSCILQCPMTYYLNYIQGIKLKQTKSALSIGSAVHWGLEHSTENLEEYYKEEGTFKQKGEYTDDQLLAESMVHGYLKHRDDIFKDILGDMKLQNEEHELFLDAKINDDRFVGIIDLLLLTDKGFVIIDYKTSSVVPDWDNYLDQIYRYIFLLRENFPGVPVVKIGIINLRKARLRRKQNENEEQFRNRLKFEYELNDENYINYHCYRPEELDSQLVDDYINNLSKMCAMAKNIDENKLFYINYTAAKGVYGKSDYYDIFYKIPDCYLLYEIKDKVWDEDDKIFKLKRDCLPLDMLVIEKNNILNKYEIYENLIKEGKTVEYIKKHYIINDELLKLYKTTYDKLVSEQVEEKK